jgi:glyoxylase-like metal-dependent hydrolase (beta-lactamase superfamily II)
MTRALTQKNNPLVWQVGDVTITKIIESESQLEMPQLMFPKASLDDVKARPWLVPDYATKEGALKMSIHALLVETPNKRLIVDTCIGNDKNRMMPEWNQLTGDFLEQLSALGWPRESVDAVLCTHLHVDHVGWNTMLEDSKWVPSFPNAKYYFGRVEYEHWRDEVEAYAAASKDIAEPSIDAEAIREGMQEAPQNLGAQLMGQQTVFTDSVRPIIDAGLEELVEMDAQLTPEIRLIPTVGHSPGHVSVVIESKGSKAIITGDIIHHPSQMAYPQWDVIFDSDAEQATDTRESFLEAYVNSDTLIIGTHFASPTGGYVVPDGDGYRLSNKVIKG